MAPAPRVQWQWCCEDVLLRVLQMLLLVDSGEYGSAWRTLLVSGARSVVSMCSTCHHLRCMLWKSATFAEVRHELQARSETEVRPTDLHNGPYAITLQRNLERHSSTQLKAMGYADRQMAFHCAASCCEVARKEVNTRYSHRAVSPLCIARVAKSVRAMAAARGASVAFRYTFRRHSPDAPTPRDTITRTHAEQGATHVMHLPETTVPYDTDVMSSMLMASNFDGTRLAFRSGDPLTEGGDEPIGGKVIVWSMHDPPETFQYVNNETVSSYDSGQTDDDTQALKHPVGIWWAEKSNVLVVAWSTTRVELHGRDETDGADVQPCERYCIAIYDECVFREAVGPFYGRLVATTNTDDGMLAAFLVREQRPRTRGATLYNTIVHDLHGRATVISTGHVWRGVGVQHTWGPSASGISPSGDRVVVVHRTLGSVLCEVFERQTGGGYVRVNVKNLDAWLTLRSTRTGDNAVKLRYRVGFSGCGRYSVVFDQRAHWRCNMDGYAAVILDLGCCISRSNIPCKPLGFCDDSMSDDTPTFFGRHALSITTEPTPPRAILWTRSAVWVLNYKGSVVFSLARSRS